MSQHVKVREIGDGVYSIWNGMGKIVGYASISPYNGTHTEEWWMVTDVKTWTASHGLWSGSAPNSTNTSTVLRFERIGDADANWHPPTKNPKIVYDHFHHDASAAASEQY